MSLAVQPSMWPLLALRECSPGEAEDLLTRWEQPLGPCNRPFGQQEFVLDIEGEAVAMATSASTVSATFGDHPSVADLRRGQVVELARIARHPKHPFILRVMLRLWRVYLAHRWPYWPITAAVSYAIPGTTGDLYRFDGWERVGRCQVSRGGGTWTKTSPKVSQIADGVKTLWVYRYAEAA